VFGLKPEVPGWRTISSFGFARISLQLADGGEKRLGLRKVEAGEAKVWPTRGLLAVGHGTNGARSNWSQALPQEQVPVLASPDTGRDHLQATMALLASKYQASLPTEVRRFFGSRRVRLAAV
jgi:hypothetical protein